MSEDGSGLLSALRDAAGGRVDLLAVHRDLERPPELFSTVDLLARCHALALALHHGGVSAGERIAVLGPARGEHWFVELAASWIGAVTVPLAAELPAEALGAALRNAAPRWIFHGGEPVRSKLAAQIDSLRHRPRSVAFDAEDRLADGPSMTRLLGAHEAERATVPLERVRVATRPDDVATILYPAAQPDGVAVTHRNRWAQAGALASRLALSPEDIVASDLPIDAPLERALVMACWLRGCAVRLLAGRDGPSRLDTATLRLLRPTVAALVPDGFEALALELQQAGEPASRGGTASLERRRRGMRRSGRWWAETRGVRSSPGGRGAPWRTLRALLVERPGGGHLRRSLGDIRLPWIATYSALGGVLATGEIHGPAGALRPLDGVALEVRNGRLRARGPAVPYLRWDQPAADRRDEEGWQETGHTAALDEAGYWTVEARRDA